MHMHASLQEMQSIPLMMKIPKVRSTFFTVWSLPLYLCDSTFSPAFVFFFPSSWNRPDSCVLLRLLYLQPSDRVPTNPSNLRWAQFYNTAAKTLRSFNVAFGVPLKPALWCTPNINRTLGSWQTRPVYRQRWGHPDGSSLNMHLLTKTSYSDFWRWCLSFCLDSKLCANTGFEKKKTNPLYLSPPSLSRTRTHTSDG